MTGVRIDTICGLVVPALTTVCTLVRTNAVSDAHGLALRGLLSGVLVPLMLPRVGAKLRRVLDADRLRIEPEGRALPLSPSGALGSIRYSDVYGDALGELANKNARLATELRDLRAAYAKLTLDAAQRAEAVERLQHLAFHDPLTQLPNRAMLTERLADALAQAQSSQSSVLVAYLDLDDFKKINDTLGHAAGDRVLRVIGARIAGCTRSGDTASRIGGDEFVVIVPTTDPRGEADRIRARLQRAISAPIDVDGTPVTTGASIGTALYPSDGTTAGELLERADKAMYGAKTRDRDRSRFAKRPIAAR